MRPTWGRTLLRASAVATALAPWAADWNRGHTFGPGYGPHARWHGTAEVVASTGDGLLMLWLLADGSDGQDKLRTTVATLLPLLRYGAFNLALAVPGRHRTKRDARLIGFLVCRPRSSHRTPSQVWLSRWLDRRARRG
ncbi:hypothetical protein J7F01_18615 [Streptomyces sp. ISL-22]|uniref:hypothetical protein n=1 Tax=unclassified Streptomyces TaxID=2593676 RepID=UPI001BEC06AD|nr:MULTISPECIES: hypothetical protein [unclassified Streptomyces]MBT2416355.1 hypothetical protein [Streptomyces sp. ISL-24]MBT2434154.1 hypothetical protein [Streptomyces sp. ISL-22]